MPLVRRHGAVDRRCWNPIVAEPNGDVYLLVTTIVEDPQYLNSRFARSSHFKREPDGSKWRPSACE